jgi:pimeloyl-ACP methyl ester carboxylesterase
MYVKTMPKDVSSDGEQQPTATPITIGNCFGWMHAGGIPGRNTAVLLCAGLHTDGLTGHHSFRLLADQLAADGYPTLRYDYPGTGDSCDVNEGEYWVVLQQSIHNAVDWLRAHTGVTSVVLCGLRIGAMLATIVAEQRNDIAGLILLAPVIRGRSYTRQLFIERRLLNIPMPKQGFELHALKLTDETLRVIEEVDLRKIRLMTGCMVSIFAELPLPILGECVSHWQNAGHSVACNDFEKLKPLLRPCSMVHEGPADFSDIMTWLRDAFPAQESSCRTTVDLKQSTLFPPGGCEIPVQFGPRGNLFGILCRPIGEKVTDLTVIIVNAGGVPHYGVARQAVEFARRLATEGISSLRMDFAGLGDSVSPYDGDEERMHIFEADRLVDINAALELLETYGASRFAIHGLCSGAYHAFRAAVADNRISALLLVNLPLFRWQQGDSLDHAAPKTARGFGFYVRKLKNAETWRLLFDGQLHPSRVITFQRKRLIDRAKTTKLLIARKIGWLRNSPVYYDMETLVRRKTRTLFLFSPWDGGLETIKREFGSSGFKMKFVTLRVIPDIDHDLTTSDMRRIAADNMIAFLKVSLDSS